ncbi:MAG: hypothetical protein AABZ47_03585 [Planctomycetota bacterium]
MIGPYSPIQSGIGCGAGFSAADPLRASASRAPLAANTPNTGSINQAGGVDSPLLDRVSELLSGIGGGGEQDQTLKILMALLVLLAAMQQLMESMGGGQQATTGSPGGNGGERMMFASTTTYEMIATPDFVYEGMSSTSIAVYESGSDGSSGQGLNLLA